jgi:hypothetical protein
MKPLFARVYLRRTLPLESPRRPLEANLAALRACQRIFTINTEASEKTCIPHLHTSVPLPCLVVTGVGNYSLGTSLRNGCRSARETAVL